MLACLGEDGGLGVEALTGILDCSDDIEWCYESDDLKVAEVKC